MGKTHRKLLKRPLRLHKLSLGQQPQSRPHGLMVTRGKSGQQKYCRLISCHVICLQTLTPHRVTTSRVVAGSFTMARECIEWLPMDHPKEQREGTGLVWAVHCSAADLGYGSTAPCPACCPQTLLCHDRCVTPWGAGSRHCSADNPLLQIVRFPHPSQLPLLQGLRSS